MELANLRPLGVGEILDTAFRFYRARFKDLIVAVAIPMVPLIALQVLVSLSSRNTTTTTTTGNSTSVNIVLGGFGATLIIGLIAGALAEGASVRILADQYLGTSTSWQESLRFAVGRLGSIVWVAVLVAVLETIGLFFCVIPGVYLWAAFALAIPALLIEPSTRGSSALSRSRLLVSGRWWPTFGTLLVVWLLAAFLRAMTSTLLTGGLVLGARVTTSTAATVLSGIIGGIVTIVFAPLTAAVATIIYFDLRIRKEGFDVALMTQRLGTPPPPTTPPYRVPPSGPPTAPFGGTPPTAPPPGPPGWAPPVAPPPGPPGWAPPVAPPPGPPGWAPPTAWPPAPASDPDGPPPAPADPPAEPPPA